MNRILAYIKGYYLNRNQKEQLRNHYGVDSEGLDYFVRLGRERIEGSFKDYDINFCHCVEVLIRVARGFKMGLFDPIDTNLIWPASQALNNDLMQLLYSKHVELCEHYSVTTPEDRDIALTKIGEFTRKLPSDTKYPAIAEYVVKKLVEDEVISGEVNEKRLFGVPDIYIESRLMFSNPEHHYN